jgi:hypothetical protein
LSCANPGSIQPIKELVLTLRVGDKSYKAWGENEEPATFDMVAYLSPWQKTPIERVKKMLGHSNRGIPLGGVEVLQIWEQGKSRKVDLRADQAFYDYVRNREWRFREIQGSQNKSEILSIS